MQIIIEGAEAVSLELGQLPARASRAMVRAMNRAIGAGRTVMVREIARDTGLTATAVRKAMPMTQASLARPEAQLAASMKRIPVEQFGARGTIPSRGRGNGVSYKNPGGGR